MSKADKAQGFSVVCLIVFTIIAAIALKGILWPPRALDKTQVESVQ